MIGSPGVGVDDPPVDCRGIQIEVGDTVVIAGAHHRLFAEKVKKIERHRQHAANGKDWDWIDVRFEGGGYNSQDRVAVVEKGNHA